MKSPLKNPETMSHSKQSEPPQLKNLSPAQQQMLAQSVSKDYKNWKQGRSRLEKKWRECWQAYLCDMETLNGDKSGQTTDRSKVVRPILYESVEAIHTNLLNNMFPADERFFTVLGKNESDHKNANLIEEFLRAKVDEMGFYQKYAQYLKQAIIIGSTIACVPWYKKTRKTTKTLPIDMFGITVGSKRERVEDILYQGPDFEVLDMFDVLIDPDVPVFEEAKVIRKLERSEHYLKSMPVYSNLDNLGRSTSMSDNSNKNAKRESFGLSTQQTENSDCPDTVLLYEAWGDFEIDGTFYENYVCTIANEERVIRFEPNPYESGKKPFVFSQFITVPNEIYGIGAIEKSLGLQHAVNTLTNQKLDVINISINNPFTYLVNDDVFDPSNIVTRPGALIPVKDHNTLKPIYYPQDYTVAFKEISDLKTEIQEATGALKFFTGGQGSHSSRTATEVSALVSGGTQKFSYFMAHLEKTSLIPFLEMSFLNTQQFLSDTETLRISHQDGSLEFLDVLPEVIRHTQCCFKINGIRGGLIKEQEVRTIKAFVDMIAEDDELRQRINLIELVKKIYRRLGFQDEANIFLQDS